MSEPLSNHMGILDNDDTSNLTKKKRQNVTDILKWACCFGLYTSNLSQKQPKRVPDLLGYQSLILLASNTMAYKGGGWLGSSNNMQRQTY